MTASALGPGDLYWTENAAFPVKVLHRYMVKRGLGVHRAGNARGRAEAPADQLEVRAHGYVRVPTCPDFQLVSETTVWCRNLGSAGSTMRLQNRCLWLQKKCSTCWRRCGGTNQRTHRHASRRQWFTAACVRVTTTCAGSGTSASADTLPSAFNGGIRKGLAQLHELNPCLFLLLHLGSAGRVLPLLSLGKKAGCVRSSWFPCFAGSRSSRRCSCSGPC